MKLLPSILIALGVAALGFALPLALSALSERHDPGTEAGWPGEWIDFSDAIPRASAIAIARIPPRWRDEWRTGEEGRYHKLDITVKWYVKGELAHSTPAWVVARRANGTPTTLPAAGLDRILFFTSGSGDEPVIFKVARVAPGRMTELRDRLGPWSETIASAPVPTTEPAAQPTTQPTTQVSAP